MMTRGLALVFALTFTPVVWAHEWFPSECCSEEDCFEVTPGEDVWIVPGGYRIVATNEFIPMERTRETPPEGRGHWARCTSDGDPSLTTLGNYPINIQMGHKACLYVPPTRF